MDTRAAILPGLPKANPTVSYWQDPPASLARHRSTAYLLPSASVVIVGSGITGSCLAHNLLLQPSTKSIVMLEARTACSGATGRNGGHTKCASYRSFLGNARTLGEEEAVKIVRFEYSCMKAVHEFARENGIKCDSWEGDTVDVIYDEEEWNLAKEAIGQIQKLLGPDDPAAKYRCWDTEKTEEMFLTKGAVGSVTYEAGSLSAYNFVIGVLGLAIQEGLNLQTETPALSIAKGEVGWIVETPRGAIKADKVVLATNGYTAHLLPSLQGVIMPLRGHITAHRPGNQMPIHGLGHTYSFIYRDGYEYMISRPPGSIFAGDIIIGGGLTKTAEKGLAEYGTTDDSTTDAETINYLRRSTETYFGSNWGSDDLDGRIRKEWSGIMGYSADGFPLVGEVPGNKNLFIAASFQGHGMVLCYSTAKALAEIMGGGREEVLSSWLPKAFRITKERMERKFQEPLHTKTPQKLRYTAQD